MATLSLSTEKLPLLASTAADDEAFEETHENLLVGINPARIHLLDLHPGLPFSGLKATLRLVEWAASPQYEALCLTWETTFRPRTIAITNGGCTQAITENLFQALRALRKLSSTRTLWISDICHVPSHHAGKEEQRVYLEKVMKNAVAVNIWLGRPHEAMPTGLSAWMAKFGSTSIHDGFIPQSIYASWRTLQQHIDETDFGIRCALYQWYLCALDRQTSVLPRTVFLCFGKHRWTYEGVFFWDYFRVPAHVYHFRQRLESLGDEANPVTWSVHSLVERNIQNDPRRRCLQRGPSRDAQNRSYSLEPFLGYEGKQLLASHSHLPPSELFAKTTFLAILSQKNFDILALRSRSSVYRTDIPTWAVDFQRFLVRDPHFGPSTNNDEYWAKFEYGEKGTSDTESLNTLVPPIQPSGTDVCTPFVALDKTNRYLSVSGISCSLVKAMTTLPADWFSMLPFDSQVRDRATDLIKNAMDSARYTVQNKPDSVCSWLLNDNVLEGSTVYSKHGDPAKRVMVDARESYKNLSTTFHDYYAGYICGENRGIRQRCWANRVFSTEDGIVGHFFNGFSEPKCGDEIILVPDSTLSFVLRAAGEYYEFVGLAIIQQRARADLWNDLMRAGYEDQVRKFVLN